MPHLDWNYIRESVSTAGDLLAAAAGIAADHGSVEELTDLLAAERCRMLVLLDAIDRLEKAAQ